MMTFNTGGLPPRIHAHAANALSKNLQIQAANTEAPTAEAVVTAHRSGSAGLVSYDPGLQQGLSIEADMTGNIIPKLDLLFSIFGDDAVHIVGE